MKEQDKHEWHPAPEIPACASDREILHALLDKLLDIFDAIWKLTTPRKK